MPNSCTQILYPIVFSTKNGERVLDAQRREDLFRYIWGINKNLNCHLHRINGVEDHLHILTAIHPSVCLADYLREVKTGSSRWIKGEGVFKDFHGWQDGYGAFTLSHRDRPSVADYIKRQEAHHKTVSFLDEYRQLLTNAGIEFDERYLA